jgi:hypothetical protein
MVAGSITLQLIVVELAKRIRKGANITGMQITSEKLAGTCAVVSSSLS